MILTVSDASEQKQRGPGKKKILLIAAALAAAALLACFFLSSFWIRLPWMEDKVYLSHGRVLKNSWVETDGSLFYTDENGNKATGLREIDGSLYYFGDTSGALHRGWMTVRPRAGETAEERRMYFSEDTGEAAVGWQTIDGDDYYFDQEGVLQTGWTVIDGKEYLLDWQGKKLTGWQRQNGQDFYLGEDGTRQTGWITVDEQKYYLDEEGRPLTGKHTIGGSTFFFDRKGILQTGWVLEHGKRYFYGKDGVLQTGRVSIDGQDLYFSEDGSADPGWHEEDGERFYVLQDGSILDYEGEPGSYGRLVVPCAGLDVALYMSSSRDQYQGIVDAEDSALVVQEREDIEPVIADRRSQGFDLSGIEADTGAVIIFPDGSMREYVCVRTTTGINLGRDVIDLHSESLWGQNEGGFCAYSSAGDEDSKEKVNVVFWEPVETEADTGTDAETETGSGPESGSDSESGADAQ